MHTVGIDVGAKTIEVVVLRDGEVVARALDLAGGDGSSAVDRLLSSALASAGLARSDLDLIVATGAGSGQVADPDLVVAEADAVARAASHIYPEVRTVVDVGAEESRAVRFDERGNVVDVAVNERCAAGTGAFTEAVARALEVDIDALGELSRQSSRTISMNAQCVVFAESEMVAMIHDNVPRSDIARAVHEAIAGRLASMVRKVGFTRPIALVGGVARNVGLRDALGRGLGIAELCVPDDPEYGAALGAALSAVDAS